MMRGYGMTDTRLIRSILNTFSDSAVLLSVEGEVLAHNEVAQQMLGFNQAMSGKRIHAFFPGEMMEPMTRYLREAVEQRTPVGFEDKRAQQILSFSLYPVLGEALHVDGLILYARDITERRHQDEADLQKTAQLEQLLEAARNLTSSLDTFEVLYRIARGANDILHSYGCSIYFLDDDGKTLIPRVVIDPVYEEEVLSTPLDIDNSFTGFAVKEGKSMIFNGTTAESPAYHIPGTSSLENERLLVVPFIIHNKPMGAMVMNRIGKMYDEEELALAETFGTYAVTAIRNAQTHQEIQYEVDVRKKAEAALNAHREDLKLINRILTHDLINNLSGIQNAIYIYETMQDDSMIGEISKVVTNSMQLIRRMKELEIFVTSHKGLKIYEVTEVLKKITEKYPEIRFHIHGKGIILADEAITSIFDNLIRNAIIHARVQQMTIQIQSREEAIQVRVMDEGPGIPDERKPLVFEENYHYGESGHSGVGLYIVKKAMERYEGSVWVEDNQPRGTVFILEFRKVR